MYEKTKHTNIFYSRKSILKICRVVIWYIVQNGNQLSMKAKVEYCKVNLVYYWYWYVNPQQRKLEAESKFRITW